MEIATLCALVAQSFRGDVVKTALWFKMTNPLLGNASPRGMIRLGRYDKLRRFVMEALEENVASPQANSIAVAGTLETALKHQETDPSAVPPLRRAPAGLLWLNPAPGF
jgi:hypothetical protein